MLGTFPAMTIFRWFIVALWLVFLAYWAIAAIGAKRSLNPGDRNRQRVLRFGIVVLIVVAFRIPVLGNALRIAQADQAGSIFMGALGAVLAALGIGCALLARYHLGRNWGMPMSRKENPELITDGPYARIRHPIYTGMILAMLGSTIGDSVYWVLPLVLFGAYFVYSARQEEGLMRMQFPDQYPAYMKRTKMLIPFVL
jgi:protein-S-isoprenylcysteine O-methyltransferase Ste14